MHFEEPILSGGFGSAHYSTTESTSFDDAKASPVTFKHAIVRAIITLALVGIVFMARHIQKSLVEQTRREINRQMIDEEDSTDITEEEPVACPQRRLWEPVDLDHTEYEAAEAANHRSDLQRELLEDNLHKKPIPPSVLDQCRERKTAETVGKLFEDLKVIWRDLQDQTLSGSADLSEIRRMVRQIGSGMTRLVNFFEEDRVAANQCMSVCCTAILKHDVRPISHLL